jgi:hypothetical protein
MVRLHSPFLSKLDAWIKQQDEPLSRPEAIRRLAEQALAGSDGRRR